MKKTKLAVIALISALLLALPLSACSPRDEVIAKVGDTEITQSFVDNICAFLLYYTYGQQIDSLTDDEQRIYKNQILVGFIVQAELLRQHLANEGKDVLSDSEKSALSAAIDDVYADETTTSALKDMNVTRTDIEYVYTAQQYYTIFKDEVIAATPVSDDDIKAFYTENEQYFIDDDGNVTPLAEMEADVRSYLENTVAGEAILALTDEIKVEYLIEVDPETGEPPVTLPADESPTSESVPALQ